MPSVSRIWPLQGRGNGGYSMKGEPNIGPITPLQGRHVT